ncbi:nuclear transport factor 2 family protein [Streptomyces sp. NPDC055287]
MFSDVPPERFLENFYTSFQEEAIFGDEEAGAVIDRYYTPDFVQFNDGILIDREKLIAHLRPVKKTLESGSYEVKEAMADGNRIAARLVVRAAMKKGTKVDTEVYLFGDLAPDGRFSRIDQITRTLSDD